MPKAARTRIGTSSTGKPDRMAGFTLVELLVVLLVLVLVIGVVTPLLIGGMRSGANIGRTARELAGGLRHARTEAIRLNRDTLFVLDTSERSYRLDAGKPLVGLPDDFEFELVTARSEQIDVSSGGIRFFADGTSTGGGITVSDDREQYRISVDWLTGRVRISD